MANIIGNYPDIARVETGLWSLDRALAGNSGLGIPMTFIELFGNQGVGKTTFVTSLMAIVAKHYGGKITYAPLEHVDSQLMGQILDAHGCTEEVTLLSGWEAVKTFFPSYKKQPKESISDELLLDCFIESVKNSGYCVGVVDSLSSIVTIAEAGSSVADRNMGRARVVSAFSRSVVHAFRVREGQPFCAIVLSHKTVPMGGGMPTSTGVMTTGGEVKKNMSKVRIGLRRLNEPSFEMNSRKELYDEPAYILEGRVEKNNFGRDDRKFFVAMLGGKGAHIGLTAMYECKRLGICSFGKSVNLGGEKFGSVATMLDMAHRGEDAAFSPFIAALQSPNTTTRVEQDNHEGEDGEIFQNELPE